MVEVAWYEGRRLNGSFKSSWVHRSGLFKILIFTISTDTPVFVSREVIYDDFFRSLASYICRRYPSFISILHRLFFGLLGFNYGR